MPLKRRRCSLTRDVRRGQEVTEGEDVVHMIPEDMRSTGPADQIVAEVYIPEECAQHRHRPSTGSTVEVKSQFTFLNLPAEIRNMIYRCLLISKAPNRIHLSTRKCFYYGGIKTAILLLNRQTYSEASPILYEENAFIACYSWRDWGFPIREDSKATSISGTRRLRSGRRVDMILYKGLIYRDVLMKLRNVEIEVEFFRRGPSCEGHALMFAFKIYFYLRQLISILDARRSHPDAAKYPWTVTIKQDKWDPDYYHCVTKSLCHTVMREILRPLLSEGVQDLVRNGIINLNVKGKFPLAMNSVLAAFRGLKNFSTADMKLLKKKEVDPFPDTIARQVEYVFLDPIWKIPELGNYSSMTKSHKSFCWIIDNLLKLGVDVEDFHSNDSD